MLVEGTIAEDTPGRGFPGEDHKMSPLADTRKPSSETVSDDGSRLPCVCVWGGSAPSRCCRGGSFRLMLQMHQRCLLSDLNRLPSVVLISVVRVDGTIAEDTPGRECPHDDRDWRPRAGVTSDGWCVCGWRRCWIAAGRGNAALPGCCRKSPSGCACWGIPPGGAVNPAGPDGPVVAITKNLEPLEHSVPDHAGPAGRHIAVGPVGPFRTLSSSHCHPAGPAGPYVAGGPVGPDVLFQVLEPLEHSVLDHADPAGQHAAVGRVGPFRTLSSSHCHPAGPAGPYVAGGPVDPDDLFKVMEPLEHSVLDHADPAGQHAVIQDVLEPLEHSVLDTVLDGRPMEWAPVLEPIEHSVRESPWTVDLWRGRQFWNR